MKRIFDEQSRGNASFVPLMMGSLSNWLILSEKAPPPLVDLPRLELLREQQWAKKDTLPDSVIRNFEFPRFETGTWTHAGTDAGADTDVDTNTNP